MPKYCFVCKDCGHFDTFKPVDFRNEKTNCPKCNKLCPRDSTYELQNSGDFTAISKSRVRLSNSMGVHPKRISAAEKRYPGSKYTPDGRLIVNSRQDKLRKMKERNLVEFE